MAAAVVIVHRAPHLYRLAREAQPLMLLASLPAASLPPCVRHHHCAAPPRDHLQALRHHTPL